MTTQTKQVIQYVALGLFSAFTLAVLSVWAYTVVAGRAADGTVLAYLGAIMATVTTLLGVNSGAATAQNATAQANQNTAAVVAAANGSGGEVAKAHVGANESGA